MIWLIALLILLAPGARAYEHKPDTPSFGFTIDYCNLLGSSDWGRAFSWEIGVAAKLRQYIAKNQAIGITLEQQKFDAVHPGWLIEEQVQPPEELRSAAHLVSRTWLGQDGEGDEVAPTSLQMQILLVDYYLYFNRPERNCPYVVLGFGGYRPELLYEWADEDSEQRSMPHVRYPKEGFIARLGAGLEHFFSHGFAGELGVNACWINARDQSGTTVSVTATAGFNIYVGI